MRPSRDLGGRGFRDGPGGPPQPAGLGWCCWSRRALCARHETWGAAGFVTALAGLLNQRGWGGAAGRGGRCARVTRPGGPAGFVTALAGVLNQRGCGGHLCAVVAAVAVRRSSGSRATTGRPTSPPSVPIAWRGSNPGSVSPAPMPHRSGRTAETRSAGPVVDGGCTPHLRPAGAATGGARDRSYCRRRTSHPNTRGCRPRPWGEHGRRARCRDPSRAGAVEGAGFVTALAGLLNRRRPAGLLNRRGLGASSTGGAWGSQPARAYSTGGAWGASSTGGAWGPPQPAGPGGLLNRRG